MKVVLLVGVFAVLALSATGAPTYKEDEVPYVNQKYVEDYLRERRAPYGGGYVPPCGAASSLQVPVYAAVPQYGVPHAPQYGGPHVPQYGVPHLPQYGYPGPHYRSAEQQNEELLGFSDMDVVPDHEQMARYGGYGGAALGGLPHAGLSSYGGHGLGQFSTGPALGVFPNARVGGCNVPLLFSCSPSIVPGHIMDSQGHGGAPLSALQAGLPESYRIVDEPLQHEAHEQHEVLEHEHVNSAHESTTATHQ